MINQQLFTRTSFVLATLLSFSTVSQAVTLAVEEFETDGTGSRYMSSAFNDGNDYFNRHNYAASNPHPSQTNNPLNSVGGGGHAEWAWAMEDITDANNPHTNQTLSTMRLINIDVSGFTNIQVKLEVAAVYDTTGTQPDTYATGEGLRIQYAHDANAGGTTNG